jgi:pyridoxine 5-phosphate synthase
MAQLSVNVNKIATLRNSRGGQVPSVVEAVRVCIAAGAPGITVHPRADERHITPADVQEIAAELASLPNRVEFNIEGDPREELLDMVCRIRPDQCTLVPVKPGEITSQAGWPVDTSTELMQKIVQRLKQADVRVSLFIDPDLAAVEWAARMQADRIELYTEPFARAFEAGGPHLQASLEQYRQAAELAHTLKLGVNAGHDLDLANLPTFGALPYLDEVSIGHALVSRAVFVGLDRVVREYLDVLRQAAPSH